MTSSNTTTRSLPSHLSTAVRSIASGWDRFWFEPQSSLSLCVFRMIFGAIMVASFLIQFRQDFSLFYGVNSIVPASSVDVFQWIGLPIFDLLLVLPAEDGVRIGFLYFSAFVAFLVMIGFATRLTTVLLFLCYLSFCNHAPIVLMAGDNYARLISLFLCFSPCGEQISVDAIIRKKWSESSIASERNGSNRSSESSIASERNGSNRSSESSIASERNGSNRSSESSIASERNGSDRTHNLKGASEPSKLRLFSPTAQRLIQVQLCVIYFVNVAYKLAGAQWRDGSAVYYATRLLDYTRVAIPGFLDTPIVSIFLTYSTLILETSFIFLFWASNKKLRYSMLLLAFVFHIGLDYSFSLGVFEWYFMASLILFIDPEDFEKILPRSMKQSSIQEKSEPIEKEVVTNQLPRSEQA